MYRAEAEKDLDEEEELFNLEEDIVNPTTYSWEDKYRPRKPRYFNRVHTGYEWNKYNQTHFFFFRVKFIVRRGEAPRQTLQLSRLPRGAQPDALRVRTEHFFCDQLYPDTDDS